MPLTSITFTLALQQQVVHLHQLFEPRSLRSTLTASRTSLMEFSGRLPSPGRPILHEAATALRVATPEAIAEHFLLVAARAATEPEMLPGTLTWASVTQYGQPVECLAGQVVVRHVICFRLVNVLPAKLKQADTCE
jgi:hypothetical protein